MPSTDSSNLVQPYELILFVWMGIAGVLGHLLQTPYRYELTSWTAEETRTYNLLRSRPDVECIDDILHQWINKAIICQSRKPVKIIP